MATNEIELLLNRLAATPARLSSALNELDEAALHSSPSQDGWSAAAILAHLRASDDILAHRLYAILVRDNPPLIALDERRWAEVAGYAQADPQASLRTFALRRAELVAMLRRAPADAWQRTAIHEERGAFTLLAAVTHLVRHEEEHCVQVEALRAGD